MLQVYSENVSVNEDAQIPFTDVSVIKGKTAELQGSASIVLNKCGVYKFSVNASVAPIAAGIASIQMEKDGVLLPDAISQATAEAATTYALGFTKLVVVSSNNDCCCSTPVTVSIVSGSEASVSINVVVDKIV